ncbi:hypothetical protein [Xenorhabdus taiwanensis]|uniref:hypothetical protein n=1 Tax=Xenorhabdus taiwanensis TaxID=3085177 RepID=UPI0035A651B0
MNSKALLSDIDLTASDVNAYTKAEVESRLEDIKDLANKANNNADSRLAKNKNGDGLSKDTLTISVTTPQLGWVPNFYYHSYRVLIEKYVQ